MVRILAARFPDHERAARAREALQRRLDQSLAVEIAPLASGDVPVAGEALLAGHFPEELKPDVEEVVREVGGEIVADVDERWTMPRQASLDTGHERGGYTY